ncbi:MAG: DegV family protein [Bacillales bacterium]|nr:DegV family protein [Bacillales bacterium]
MAKILISTDTTCDLSKEILEKRGIKQTSLHVLLGMNEYKDGVDITPQDIFTYVEKTNTLPKTSAVSIQEYTDFFEENLHEYDNIIHFTISSDLSSTYNNARLAAESFSGKVTIIDSRNLSSGQGLLVLKACDLLDEGKTYQEIIDEMKKMKNHVQVSFVVDTVDYLYKGGRCSGVARFASNVFKIHPSIEMIDGKLSPKKHYRGALKKCIENYVKDLAIEFTKYDNTRVFITHACCSNDVVELITSVIKEYFNFNEINITVAGSVITSHCGKGTLGVLFIKE